jgi:DNA-directed RNA polymerase subunit RPC12/RpoP
MGSMRAFRCQRCRAEMLARVHALRAGIRAAGMPSILCCGVPVRVAEPEAVLGDILTGALAQGRAAHCPCCGFRIRLVVHPLGRLVCRDCRVDFLIGGSEGSAGGAQAGAAITSRPVLSPR